MSILNVNQIQPVGSGQTVTISAANITASSSTISASSFVGGVTVTSGNLTGISSVSTTNLTVNGNAYPSAGPLSNRNHIINGGMQVWQRGTAYTPSANQYGGADRWFNTNTPYTFTRATNTLGGPCAYMLTLSGGASDSRLRYIIELPNSGSSAPFLVGSSWTFSFYCSTDFSGVGFTMQWKDSNNGSATGATTTGTFSQIETNRYAATFQIDTANDGKAGIAFTINNGFAFTGSITGVQLEEGTVATPFEHRSYGDELARCQRYYWMIQNESPGAVCQGVLYNTNNFYSVVHFPVTMRAAPTLDVSNATDYFRIFSNASLDAFDTMISNNPTVKSIELRAESTQGVGGRTAGHAAWVRLNNASAYIAVTAEL